MATIVNVRDKRSGILYAYSSVSYWNKEKKQGRSHRKLLGRVDENTGEIVPTSGRRGRPPKSGPVAKRQLSQIPASDKEGQANDQKLRTAKEKANVSAPSKPIDVKKSDSSHSSAEEDRLHHEIESKNNIIVNQSKQIAELTIQLQAVQRAVSDFQAAIAKILSNEAPHIMWGSQRRPSRALLGYRSSGFVQSIYFRRPLKGEHSFMSFYLLLPDS